VAQDSNEAYLVFETNRRIFRAGELVKVICRQISRAGQLTAELPQVRILVRALDPPKPPDDGEPLRELHLSELHDDVPRQVGRLNTEGLPSGGYVLEAERRDGRHFDTVEREILVLSADDYDRFWSDLAHEEPVDQGGIELPQDLLPLIRGCLTDDLMDRLLISQVQLEVHLLDRRKTGVLGPLPTIRQAWFEWIHANLFEAGYEKVFSGGTMAIQLTVLENGLQSRLLLTSRTGDVEDDVPPFLRYLKRGERAQIDHHRVSEYQYEISCAMKEEVPAVA
jgi:hypothetical protein